MFRIASELRWEDRLPQVQKLILLTWDRLKNGSNEQWLYKGVDRQYYMSGVDEHALIKKMIKESPLQKEFYVLDIGGGNFGFSRALVRSLNLDQSIPDDVVVHVIGIRGEIHFDILGEKVGKCKVYELGFFQIENIIKEFEARNLDFINKLDYIVSRWTFRHLVDPVGTLRQVLELLREDRYLAMDGFFFFVQDCQLSQREHLLCLLKNLKLPFLYRYYTLDNALDQFIIKKSKNIVINLGLSYHCVEQNDFRIQNNSQCITSFSPMPEYERKYLRNASQIEGKDGYLLGNDDLYWFLLDAKVLVEHSYDISGSLDRFAFSTLEKCGINDDRKKLDAIELEKLQTADEFKNALISFIYMYTKLTQKHGLSTYYYLQANKNSREEYGWGHVLSVITSMKDEIYSSEKNWHLMSQLLKKYGQSQNEGVLGLIREALKELRNQKLINETDFETIIKKSHTKGFMDRPANEYLLIGLILDTITSSFVFVIEEKTEPSNVCRAN